MSDFDLQGLAQVYASIEIPAHKRIINDGINEIVSTRRELAAAKTEIERLRDRVADQHEQLLEIHGVTSSISEVDIQPADYSETLTVRRVKEMAILINQMSGWIDETKRKVSDLEIISQKGDDKVFQKFSALILRKQAEAVEASKKNYNANSRLPDGTLSQDYAIGYAGAEGAFQDSLDLYAQSLRQQANELEAGGSEI